MFSTSTYAYYVDLLLLIYSNTSTVTVAFEYNAYVHTYIRTVVQSPLFVFADVKILPALPSCVAMLRSLWYNCIMVPCIRTAYTYTIFRIYI